MNMTRHDDLPSARKATGLDRPLKSALWRVALVGEFYLLREHWTPNAGNCCRSEPLAATKLVMR